MGSFYHYLCSSYPHHKEAKGYGQFDIVTSLPLLQLSHYMEVKGYGQFYVVTSQSMEQLSSTYVQEAKKDARSAHSNEGRLN